MAKQTQLQVINAAYEKAMLILRRKEDGDVIGLMDTYRRAQVEILMKIDQQIMAGNWDLASMQQTDRLQGMLNSINQTLTKLRSEINGGIEDSAVKQFAGAYQNSVYAMDQATPDNIEIEYSPPPTDAVKILVNTPYKGAMFSQRIGIITDAMASDLRDELMQSLIQGEGMEDAARRVRDVIGIADLDNPQGFAARARTIARTEIMRAQNLARDYTYEQNNDLLQGDGDTDWLVTPDDKLCPWCMRREGLSDEEIEKAPAEVGGKTDPWGKSTECPLHPHCRCTKIPRLKSWKDLIGLDMPESLPNDFRGMRDPDSGKWTLAPVQTFNAWLEDRQLASAL